MNDNKPAEKAVLTVDEVCERWGYTRRTVLRAIRDGNLRAFKLGKRTYRIALTEVKRYELGKAA